MAQKHPSNITFTVGTIDDYDKGKLICALEGFANQFDLIPADKNINATSAQHAIERIFEHADKKAKEE